MKEHFLFGHASAVGMENDVMPTVAEGIVTRDPVRLYEDDSCNRSHTSSMSAMLTSLMT